jgi:hypothetical protein
LKFKNKKGASFHTADWIAGVDYDENSQQEDDNDEAYEDENNEDPKEEQYINEDQYNQIDEDKLEDLNEDARQEDNHNQHLEQDEVTQDDQEEDGSKDDGTAVVSEPESDSQASAVRRSMRTSQPVLQLEHEWQVAHAKQQKDKESIICQIVQTKTIGTLPQPGCTSKTRRQ